MVHLSVVIPAYNEERRIGPTLSSIYDFLSKKGYDFEVILVDDGSTDQTIEVSKLSKLCVQNRLVIIENGTNKGKGFSVKKGISSSKGEYVLFCDADLSTPISEIDKLFGIMSKGCDIIIGSRALKDSSVVLRQPWYRELMGKAFNVFVKILLMGDFKDTQCGFKLFKGEAAREIARRMSIDGFAFDVEVLCIAKAKKYKIKECGVLWENSPESKVKLFHSPASMFFDLIKIKIVHG